eukprot:scaffold30612_cov30-Tisochrysis_lutea.AAC.2
MHVRAAVPMRCGSGGDTGSVSSTQTHVGDCSNGVPLPSGESEPGHPTGWPESEPCRACSCCAVRIAGLAAEQALEVERARARGEMGMYSADPSVSVGLLR